MNKEKEKKARAKVDEMLARIQRGEHPFERKILDPKEEQFKSLENRIKESINEWLEEVWTFIEDEDSRKGIRRSIERMEGAIAAELAGFSVSMEAFTGKGHLVMRPDNEEQRKKERKIR